jgi:hypothetical protein
MTSAAEQSAPYAEPTIQQLHDALQEAVTAELDRKRRLGHYVVFWEDGQVVLRGDDAPAPVSQVLQAAEPQGPVYAATKHKDASN